MITDLNKYINDNIIVSKKNRMFIFYNLDHLSNEEEDSIIRILINNMLKRYHSRFSVEFIYSDKNRVIVKKIRESAIPARLRLTQIEAGKMFKDIITNF